jgi:hypothetical protein
MTQDLFTGASNVPFAGAAASFGGTIKGLSVMRRGVCSHEEAIGDSFSLLSTLVTKEAHISAQPFFSADLAALGMSSYVDYSPKGGFVLMTEADGFEVPPPPFPPVLNTFSLDANITYQIELDDDGVAIVDTDVNTWSFDGADYWNVGGLLHFALVEQSLPNAVRLASLEGRPGTFKGGQAQPIPALNPSDVNGNPVDCSNTDGQRPSACFMPCRSTDSVDMTNDGTWPAPPQEFTYDPSLVDPPSWHDSGFCGYIATALGPIVASAATAYPNMTADPLLFCRLS